MAPGIERDRPHRPVGSPVEVVRRTPPTAGAASGVTDTALTFDWTSTNGSGTQYAAELSTDSFATLVQSSDTLNLSAAFSGLTPNLDYELRVKTLSSGGWPSSNYSATISTIGLRARSGQTSSSFARTNAARASGYRPSRSSACPRMKCR